MTVRTYIFILLTPLLAVTAGTVPAQSYTIDKASTKHGLGSGDIHCTAQDRHGTVYVGTGSGLYRFNGTDFEPFPAGDGLEGIAGHAVVRILTDRQSDSLWVTVDDKIVAINTLDYGVTTHYTPPHTGQASRQTLADACFASDDQMWILPSQGELKLLSLHTGKVSPMTVGKGHFPHTGKNLCMAKDRNGILYIGHQGEGLSVYNPHTLTVKRYVFRPGTDGLPGNEVTDICVDSHQRIWIATHWGLALFNPRTERFVTFTHKTGRKDGLSDSDIHSLREIGGKLWIGTWSGGVNILNPDSLDTTRPQEATFGHITAGDLPSRLSSCSIVDIYNDSFGNIWLGSANNGLNIIPHISRPFHSIAYSPLREETNGLSDKAILSLCNDREGNIWIGTDNGNIDIYSLLPATSSYEKKEHLHMTGGITAMTADRDGMIWMGIDKTGLVRYNPQTRYTQKIQLGTDPYIRTYIYALHQTSNGDMWIGTHDGLFVCKPQDLKAKPVDGGLWHNAGVPIQSIAEDHHNNIWVASEGNVFIITPQGQQIKKFVFQSGYISCLYPDSKGRVWIAEGRNLHYTTTDSTGKYPLHTVHAVKKWDSDIRSVMEGADGSLWMTDSRRIIRYSPEKDKVQFFDHRDGIPGAVFKPHCHTRVDDFIFFAQQDGICYFDSRESIPFYRLEAPRITSVTVETPAGQKELPLGQDIELKHVQHSFTIRCGVTDYAMKDMVEHSYSLDRRQWFAVTHGNRITFQNLAPGSYTVYVRARVHNQTWSDSVASLKVHIAPPLWLTWWAKLLYASVCVMMFIIIIRRYKRKLRKKSLMQLERQRLKQEQKLNDERLRFYTDVTHELRTPLTLILGPLKDLETEEMKPSQTKRIMMIHKSAYRLYELVNQILEFRKSDTCNRTLTVTQGDLSVLVREVTLKYKELNSNGNVTVDCLAEVPCILWFDKEAVTVILDNMLSNALKHTSAGRIEVGLLQSADSNGIQYTEVSVSDTGSGIPKADMERVFDCYYHTDREGQTIGTGIGLALAKKLAELHQGHISVESEVGKGSTFRFRIRTDNEYPDAVHTVRPADTDPQTTEDAVPQTDRTVLLVVEDNDDIRSYIKDSLTGDFEILTATNGREGIDVALERMPDIIVSDIMMPVTDGIELCRTLKRDARTSHIPIVLLTAKDTEDNKAEGYLHGADSYITKPFSVQLLKTRISNLLHNRERIAGYFTSGTYKRQMAENAISRMDKEFMEKVCEAIEKNISDEQINITALAEGMNMSYSTFYRKMKALTGITANEFIRKIKMRRAEQMILTRKYTLTEIMTEVGYNSRTAFREAFKAEFGVAPSKYLDNINLHG